MIIHAKLVKKQRFHFTTLKGLDVDIIAGLNGLIWISPHVQRADDGTVLRSNTTAAAAAGGGRGMDVSSAVDDPAAISAAAAAAAGPSLQQREAVARVAGAIRALASLMLQVYPDSIISAYQVRAETDSRVSTLGLSAGFSPVACNSDSDTFDCADVCTWWLSSKQGLQHKYST